LTEIESKTVADLVSLTTRLVTKRLDRIATTTGLAQVEHLLPGKMLRTRLAGRLLNGSPPPDGLEAACAATELVHTASLCHDDVIDNATVRRGRPSLWKVTSPSGAVLLGDLLLCEAMDLLAVPAPSPYLRDFLGKVRQIIDAETEQELLLRGREIDAEACLRLARDKTGPLFAFVARAAGGPDAALAAALEEAGYRIGTAYQLADDLFDVIAGEDQAGKTLGTDRARGKFTLAQGEGGAAETTRRVTDLCRSALAGLDGWPRHRAGLARYLVEDLQPVFDSHGPGLSVAEDLTL